MWETTFTGIEHLVLLRKTTWNRDAPQLCSLLRNLTENVQRLICTIFQDSTEVEYDIYASVNQAIIGLNDGLVPHRPKALIWTKMTKI